VVGSPRGRKAYTVAIIAFQVRSAHYPGATREPFDKLGPGLGEPDGSWTTEVSGAPTRGKRMVCHKRGNSETEVGRTLNADERTHTDDEPGKELTGSRSRQRKPCPDMEGRISKADGCLLSALTAGNSEGASKEAFAEAALFGTNRHCLKSPVRLSVTGRGKPHAGMCVQRRLACSAGDSPVGVKNQQHWGKG